MAARSLPDQGYLLQRLCYNAETGVLTWKELPDGHFGEGRSALGTQRRWNSRHAGKQAGCSSHHIGRKTHYWVLRMDGVIYAAHRVIWKMIHGTEPPLIDHMNGNCLDNSLKNLRIATKAQNAQNMRCRERTLPKGVGQPYKSGRYPARIVVNGRSKHLGTFDTPQLAHQAYAKAAIVAFGEFANIGHR